MNKPDFYIAGAPKSGTTALYSYLSSHPHIFMPELKEPHFWCEDYPNIRRVKTLEEYLSLFLLRTDEHIVAGEASVTYLESEVALKRIAEFNPDSKIILLLRNPVDMIQAFHSELLWNQNEDVEDFEKAWALQDERKAGKNIPKGCLNPAFLLYRNYASYGQQVDRMFEVFSKEKVKIFTFDEFVESIEDVYEEALSFLGVPSDGRNTFPKVNENKNIRSKALARLMLRPPQQLVRVVSGIKRLLGVQHLGISSLYLLLNKRPGKRKALSPQFRSKLIEEFKADVTKLECLIDKDLSSWKR